MNVCLAPSSVLSCPTLGGHAWVYGNWSLGFQANGCHVVWLERFKPDVGEEAARHQLLSLRACLDMMGVHAPIALLLTHEQRDRLRGVKAEIERWTVPFADVAADTDLLLNFYYELEPEILTRFRVTALVDIDPGLLQFWIHQKQLNVARHDLYFTTGETVGAPDSRIPDCGLAWQYTPPVVDLGAWPVVPGKADSRYTTVSTWWADWEVLGERTFSNEKRTSFLEYVDVPAETSCSLELALYMLESETEQRDREVLRGKGWSLQDPSSICATPHDYRRYIQSSRGEFSCAKPSCMLLSNAWVSDRTLCYLSSGKPAIVQYTGRSRILPDGEGLFRFRTPREAVRALEQVEADYERQSRLARSLVEECFAANTVAARLLDRALG